MRGIKNIRLPGYNYRSDGWYFITIVTSHRQRFFQNALTSKKCENIFRNSIKKAPGASFDTLVIMPDHVHFIVQLEECQFELGEIVRRMKARSSKEFAQSLWQPNYYEHIIRDECSLDAIREYVLMNPDVELTFGRIKSANGR